MKKFIQCCLYAFLISAFLPSCVSKKAYDELKEEKKYLEYQASESDSLRVTTQEMSVECRQTELQYKRTLRKLERMTVVNESLNRSYQDLLERFNNLLDQNKDVLSTTSYEKQSLTEQLAAQKAELDYRERALNQLAYELEERERRLNYIEGDYADLEGDLVDRNARIMELEALVSLKEGNMTDLRRNIDEALTNFSATDLSVSERKGRLYVSLSQELLFRSGSKRIDSQGEAALAQLATVLNDNPDIEIVVEGHTDSDGSAERNWELSVLRATAVVNVLTDNGVDPKRVTASGRAFFDPVASNATSSGKAQNRRTEIILSPNLDELYDILYTSGNQ